jgi:hypothetical protein
MTLLDWLLMLCLAVVFQIVFQRKLSQITLARPRTPPTVSPHSALTLSSGISTLSADRFGERF